MVSTKRRPVRLLQVAIVASAAVVVALAVRWSRPRQTFLPERTSSAVARVNPPESDSQATNGSSDLLREVRPGKSSDAADFSGPIATTEQLEKQFSIIAQNQRQVTELKDQATNAAAARQVEVVKKDVAEGKSLISLLNLRLAAFERDLDAARGARPRDATVQWLTGELLLIVGGEPEEILPYLQRAAAAGLKRPELHASLAKVEFDLNHFQAAYDEAVKAVQGDSRSRDSWEVFSRASFALERFGEVIQRLDRAFPSGRPDWAETIRSNAEQLQRSWRREVALRKTEEKSDNLPLVRLVIEHRQFAVPAGGRETPSVKTTGSGEVILEMFEDQAPATVANFISLVEAGFYNGTSFYWAEAGHMVVGGDPNTKNDNPADDGTGGPGYVIPDEFSSSQARSHFRGTISTVQSGPRKAGSQFFIALIPSPEFDGHSTTFGRVIRGEEVMEQVTEGRTNRKVGEFGKIIPGDLLVRAEVIRKRPHVYRAAKIAP